MKDLAKVFRALSDANRLAIFELLRRRCAGGSKLKPGEVGPSVSRIAEEFDLSLSTVSHHLKELRTAGLISCERQGQHIFCSVNPDTLAEVERFISRGR